MKKKALAIICALIMMIGVLPMTVMSATKLPNEPIRYDFERFYADYLEYAIITAYDSNNTICWVYQTGNYAATELCSTIEIGVYDNRYYIVEGGAVICMDKANGNVIWKSESAVGASNTFCFDDKGNLYITGYYTPHLSKIDKNGNCIWRFSYDGFMWPHGIRFDNDLLQLTGVKYDSLEESVEMVLYVNPETGVKYSSAKVFVNGAELSTDQPAVIVEGRTLVPLRAIFEAIGATVDWNNDTKTVTSTKGSDTVSLKIGDNKLYKNGSAATLDVPAQIINSRTMVPARAVSEAFGCKVGWDGSTKTVTITG